MPRQAPAVGILCALRLEGVTGGVLAGPGSWPKQEKIGRRGRGFWEKGERTRAPCGKQNKPYAEGVAKKGGLAKKTVVHELKPWYLMSFAGGIVSNSVLCSNY